MDKVTLYDTLRKRGRDYMVIAETENAFILRELRHEFNDPPGSVKRIKLLKSEYYDGTSGFRRLDIGRVTVTHIDV